MNAKIILLSLGGVVLLAAVVFAALWQGAGPRVVPNYSHGENEGIVCTMDAKICPDGSSVGRVPPTCEFAQCRPSSATATRGEVSLGQTITLNQVSITPVSVVEDSRCPVDVTCIQAGTTRLQVRIKTALGESTQTVRLEQPLSMEGVRIEFVGVTPAPRSTEQIIPSVYRFTFEVRESSEGDKG